MDPETGKKIGLETGDPRGFKTFEELYDAWHRQMEYFVNLKLSVNNYIERMFSLYAPATFLSLYIEDCIDKGKDYYSGGARYNTTYIQCTGLGTITDCFTTLKKHVFETGRYTMDQLLAAVADDWKGHEPMRLYIRNHTPFFGNDDAYADDIAVRVYDDLVKAIEGRPNTRGGKTQLNMLSTTCHNYFGQVCGASVNGRFAHFAISDGTSPAHGDLRRAFPRQAGPDQERRHPAERPLHPGPPEDRRRSGQARPAHPRVLQAGRPSHPVQHRGHGNPLRRPAAS